MRTHVVRTALLVCMLVASLLTPISTVVAASTSSPETAATTVIQVPTDVDNLEKAIDQVPDGGIIELAAGTYVPPSDGWRLHNPGKGFTIRAAPGANVTLDGQGSREILRFQNSSRSDSGPVTFEGLTFANGRATTEGTAAVTLYQADATFVNCEFKNNRGFASTTVGGAVYAADHSVVFFIETVWAGNSSQFGGAALGARGNAKIFIHASQFIDNHANPEDHSLVACGGAISVGNSLLRVTNTRFENNEAGAYGGALYAIGNWEDPVSSPRTDVILANTTFVNNRAVRHPSREATFPTEGGAVNVEDQSRLRVYNSRFINNEAHIGGGINVYRADVEVYESVFRGNRASGTQRGASFGGAISLNSSDVIADGYNNYPTANLIARDTFFDGSYGGVTSNAFSGGCIHAHGDWSRMDGDSDVPDIGDLTQNRAKVELERVVFYDCAAAVNPDSDFSGTGGAIETVLTSVSMQASMVLSSDATGAGASGGGVAVLYNSIADIENSVIAYNNSGLFGGGVFAQGSELNIRESKLFGNEVSPGVAESIYASFGAAIFSTPDEHRGLNTRGSIEDTIFSGNIGLSVFDDDRTDGPINDVKYSSTEFFESTYAEDVYKSALSSALDPSGLNSLVIQRSNGTVTDKAETATTLPSEPVLLGYHSVPGKVLPQTAAGDPTTVGESYIVATWTTGDIRLNGISAPKSEKISVMTCSEPGEHEISVGSTTHQINVVEAERPAASFSAIFSADQEVADLNWDVTAGRVLDVAVDQGVDLGTSAGSGSAQHATPVLRTYHFYAITEQGGVLVMADAYAPGLWTPTSQTIMLEVYAPETPSQLMMRNTGGSSLSWTASTTTPDLIGLSQTSGEFTEEGHLSFSVDIGKSPTSTYYGYIDIDAGTAGSQRVEIIVKVVDELYGVFLPMSVRQ